MTNSLKYFAILILIILIAIIYYFLPINILGQPLACINSQCFNLEIAQTSKERQQGLMHRTILPTKNGMLFVFPESRLLKFWMKDTLIPLDIIYIQNNQITEIYKNVQPCQVTNCPNYPSGVANNMALEINAGLSQKFDINVGQTITINQ